MKKLLIGVTLLLSFTAHAQHEDEPIKMLTDNSHETTLAQEDIQTLRHKALPTNIGERIHNTLQKNNHDAIIKECTEGTSDLKQFVKTHPTYSGLLALSLMGAKRTKACIRFMVCRPHVLAIASVATIGAHKTLLYIENAYHAVEPFALKAKQEYDAALQKISNTIEITDNLE